MLVHERRFFSAIIDIGIVLVISMIINAFIPNMIFDSWMTLFVIYFIVNFIYMSLCLLITKDKTIGLYSMSLRLLSRDWNKISKKVILIRAISHGVLALHLINILYMLLNKTEDTFFDELSDSFVIRTGETYGISDEDDKVDSRTQK